MQPSVSFPACADMSKVVPILSLRPERYVSLGNVNVNEVGVRLQWELSEQRVWTAWNVVCAASDDDDDHRRDVVRPRALISGTGLALQNTLIRVKSVANADKSADSGYESVSSLLWSDRSFHIIVIYIFLCETRELKAEK